MKSKLSHREITGKRGVKNCGETYTKPNSDAIGDDNFCHKSIQGSKSLTSIFRN
jgi:hypothetical protein